AACSLSSSQRLRRASARGCASGFPLDLRSRGATLSMVAGGGLSLARERVSPFGRSALTEPAGEPACPVGRGRQLKGRRRRRQEAVVLVDTRRTEQTSKSVSGAVSGKL